MFRIFHSKTSNYWGFRDLPLELSSAPGHTTLVLTMEPTVVAQHLGLRRLHSAGPRISRGCLPERSGADWRAAGPPRTHLGPKDPASELWVVLLCFTKILLISYGDLHICCHLSAVCHWDRMQLRLDVERRARIWWVCCHLLQLGFRHELPTTQFAFALWSTNKGVMIIYR